VISFPIVNVSTEIMRHKNATKGLDKWKKKIPCFGGVLPKTEGCTHTDRTLAPLTTVLKVCDDVIPYEWQCL
jgi:hypothetical protein